MPSVRQLSLCFCYKKTAYVLKPATSLWTLWCKPKVKLPFPVLWPLCRADRHVRSQPCPPASGSAGVSHLPATWATSLKQILNSWDCVLQKVCVCGERPILKYLFAGRRKRELDRGSSESEILFCMAVKHFPDFGNDPSVSFHSLLWIGVRLCSAPSCIVYLVFPFPVLLSGCSRTSSYWDWSFKLLLSTLFLIECVLTSQKEIKVHLQYVKSMSWYQEVASGTVDKMFWL